MLMGAPVGAIDPYRSLEQLQHSSWTVRDGAPTYVLMMAQTDDGFLWFATGSGLVRFDGIQFERYVLADGRALPEAPIRSLFALPDNGLLVGWFFGGASLIRDGRVTDYGEKDGYPPGTTNGFVRDRSGRIWAAVSRALARFDGERWHRVGREWNFEGQRAIAIFLDRDGTLGAFTDDTLMTLADGATAFRPTGGRTTTRSPIVQSPSGALYLSESRGIRAIASLAEYDRVNVPWATRFARPRDTVPILADRDGGLWFVSEEGVRRIPDPERRDARVELFSKVNGLSDVEADQVFEDREGSIWVATPGGVDRFRAGAFLPIVGAAKPGFPAMIPDSDGGIWFAGFGANLNHATRDGSVREVAPLFATSAYVDPRGVGWFGSQPLAPRTAELWRFEKGSVQRVPLPPDIPPGVDVQAVVLDATGALWVSIIRKGVYRRVNGRWEQAKELVDEGRRAAVAMTAEANGRVWFGYVENRLVLWENGSARTYSAADGLDLGNVLVIHEKGGHLWVAGERGLGLVLSGRVRKLKTVEPDVLRGITGVVETREGDLWVHALVGAILVRKEELRRAIDDPHHRMAYRLFNYQDGLNGAATEIRPLPTLVQSTDGRLWFATKRGPFVLDPAGIVPNRLPPPVIIKSALAGTTRHQAPRSLQLPALTSNLEFDYTATSLAAARRVQFRYRLLGADRDWQEAGTRRQAFYTNLGPGRYRFQVIASNEDGVWNTTGASVDVTIAPAWYQTAWFFVLCGLVAIGTLALFYRARLHQVRTQVQRRLQERLLERERIARDLHDTLIQSFQGLVLTLSGAVRRIPQNGPARLQMEKALTRADEALAEGRDRVRDLRTPISLHGDLAAALKEAADDFALVHPSVTFDLTVQGTPRALHPVVMEEAYRIGREALANAYYHGGAANIGVEIDYSIRQLRLRIRDDGKGIDRDVLAQGGIPGHWGMTGMRERSQKLGARLMVRSGSGSGTDVELDIPAAVAYRASAPIAWWRRLFRFERSKKRGDDE
jgi:signal transduction histidine kinase/ligand-binding sensor domain-containing protein